MSLITITDRDGDLLTINTDKIIAIDWEVNTEIDFFTIYLDWAGKEKKIEIPKKSYQEVRPKRNLEMYC